VVFPAENGLKFWAVKPKEAKRKKRKPIIWL